MVGLERVEDRRFITVDQIQRRGADPLRCHRTAMLLAFGHEFNSQGPAILLQQTNKKGVRRHQPRSLTVELLEDGHRVERGSEGMAHNAHRRELICPLLRLGKGCVERSVRRVELGGPLVYALFEHGGRLVDPRGHIVERARETAQLVLPTCSDARAAIALRDTLRCALKLSQWTLYEKPQHCSQD